MRPPSTVGRNELQSFQTLLQPRDQASVWEGGRERGRGLKPRRISNKFTETKGERRKQWKQRRQTSPDQTTRLCFFLILEFSWTASIFHQTTDNSLHLRLHPHVFGLKIHQLRIRLSSTLIRSFRDAKTEKSLPALFYFGNSSAAFYSGPTETEMFGNDDVDTTACWLDNQRNNLRWFVRLLSHDPLSRRKQPVLALATSVERNMGNQLHLKWHNCVLLSPLLLLVWSVAVFTTYNQMLPVYTGMCISVRERSRAVLPQACWYGRGFCGPRCF